MPRKKKPPSPPPPPPSPPGPDPQAALDALLGLHDYGSALAAVVELDEDPALVGRTVALLYFRMAEAWRALSDSEVMRACMAVAVAEPAIIDFAREMADAQEAAARAVPALQAALARRGAPGLATVTPIRADEPPRAPR